MKKLILTALLILTAVSPLFAMGSRGSVSPLGQCYVNADNACSQYGNAWFPNPEVWTNPDGTTVRNTVYDATKPTYDKAAADACKAPLYEACRLQFQR
jgi:hypothetical protein